MYKMKTIIEIIPIQDSKLCYTCYTCYTSYITHVTQVMLHMLCYTCRLTRTSPISNKKSLRVAIVEENKTIHNSMGQSV
jgi:hypothetical protein